MPGLEYPEIVLGWNRQNPAQSILELDGLLKPRVV